MSDYALVTQSHQADAALAQARKTGDAAAVAAAEAAAAAAKAQVTAALADGRLVSAAHISDLPPDCLAMIFGWLPPSHAVACAAVCRDWRAAVAQTPARAVADFKKLTTDAQRAAWLAALAPRADVVRRLTFRGLKTGADAAFVRTALDAAPRATRLEFATGAWADITPATDLAAALAGARPGLEVATSDTVAPAAFAALAGAAAVVELATECSGARLPALPPMPALRKLHVLVTENGHRLAAAQSSLTAAGVAPALREVSLTLASDEDKTVGPARFWAALAGATRVDIKHDPSEGGIYVERGGVGAAGLAAVTALRALSLWWATFKIPMRGAYGRAREADILTKLPPLPGLTRLTAGAGVRFARFERGALPALRVLDLRGASDSVYVDQSDYESTQEELFLTPVFPAFADGALPALRTLLLGFQKRSYTQRAPFDMTALLRLPPSIRVVVIEYAHCHVALAGSVSGPPDALAARVRGALAHASLHWHDCEFGEKKDYDKQTVPKSADLPAGAEQTMVAALRDGVAKWCECVDGCSVCTLLEAGWGDDVRKEAEVEEG